MGDTFHFRINGGPEKTVTVPYGLYDVAVAAALGQATEEQAHGHMQVEIWYPAVLPEYGPYHYRVVRNAYGNLEIMPDLQIGGERRPPHSIHSTGGD